MKTNKIDLSIVIPALNEENRIGASLNSLAIFLKTDKVMKNLTCEVLVVSANGTDNTHRIAKSYGKQLKNFNLLLPGEVVGKGRDVKYGMLKSKGRYSLFMDADLATPLHHIPEFYKIAETGSDMVIATRNLKKHHSHLPRRALSLMGNTAFRVLGGVWVEDSQCGFKLFSKNAKNICFNKQTIMKWGFDMELLTIANTNDLAVQAIRINDWTDVPGGTFASGHIIQHAAETLRELLHIAKNRFVGKYKLR